MFTAREELLEVLKKNGFFVALLGEGHSLEAAALADETIPDYQSLIQ